MPSSPIGKKWSKISKCIHPLWLDGESSIVYCACDAIWQQNSSEFVLGKVQ